MLKEKLASIIYNHIYFAFESTEDGLDITRKLAQAIVDRLEIDEKEIYIIIRNSGFDTLTADDLAHEITDAKPIKLKESDK